MLHLRKSSHANINSSRRNPFVFYFRISIYYRFSFSQKIRSSISVPTPAKITGTLLTCPQCFRLNNADARFCDWCGATPDRKSLSVQCTTCRSTNEAQAKFCLNCGCVMEPPLRSLDSRIRTDLSRPHSAIATSMNPTLAPYRSTVLLNKTEAATQTYGIYYPSAKDIELLITQNKRLQAEQSFKENRPVLTSVSPGKGYWKQQIDHVCEHLKAYAVNQPEFRVSIGNYNSILIIQIEIDLF